LIRNAKRNFEKNLANKNKGNNRRPCITRRWTHAVLCLGWLNIFLSIVEVEAAKGVPYR
jgi:hypothetical protein